MAIDWIDSLLQKAESVTKDWPVIGGAVHDLRFAYEVWRKDPVDPNVVKPQTQNLSDLHTRALSLLQQYNASLPNLRANWSGKRATQYFTGGQAGSGVQLGNNLYAYSCVLNYNQTAHQHAINKLNKIQSLHGQLDFQVKLAAGTLAVMVGEDVIPLFGEAADAVEAPIFVGEAAEGASLATDTEAAIELTEAVDEVGQATEFGEAGLETSETLGDLGDAGGDIPPPSTGPTWTPLKVIAFAVTALGAAAMVADITLAAFTPPAPIMNSVDLSKLTPAQQALFNKLRADPAFKDISDEDLFDLIQKGFTEAELRALIARGLTPAQIHALADPTTGLKPGDIPFLQSKGYTDAQITQLLQNWARLSTGEYISPITGASYSAGTLRALLDSAQGLGPNKIPQAIVGAQRELYVLMTIGPNNVAALSVNFDVTVGGAPQHGEADLILMDGTVVEVGGSGKATQVAAQAAKYREFMKDVTGGSQIWLYVDDGGDPKSIQKALRTATQPRYGSPPGTPPPVNKAVPFTLP